MSTRRQDRRQAERRARAVKARQAALPKTRSSFFANLSADWIAGGIIGGVVLIIGLVFASSWFFSRQGTVAPLFPQVFSLAASPNTPNRFLIGDVSGLFISNDGGKKWSPHVITDPVRKVYYDPNDASTFYAIGSATIRRSTDGGLTWSDWTSNLPGGAVNAMASDPADSSKRYAFVALQGLFKSEDGGATWSQQNPFPGASINSLAVKAGAPDTVYAFHDTDGLVVSLDNGKRFDPIESSVLPSRAVSDILTIAGEPETIYVTADQAVYKSSDGGREWLKLESGLSGVRAVALSRDSLSGKLYLTDPRGIVYSSSNGGESWLRNAS
ncbi:MAG: hypothetical protein HW397_79 [Dehalococcoidia bacterium]|nr:hypothetical protein [Dehalococcoidia bacterium]